MLKWNSSDLILHFHKAVEAVKEKLRKVKICGAEPRPTDSTHSLVWVKFKKTETYPSHNATLFLDPPYTSLLFMQMT